nr:very short patch repair endonuclease [uncultured Massilia sp.]
MDIVEPKVRSRMMSAVRGKDTKPELIVRRFLHRKGFRFRLHVANLPGRPDLAFPKHKVALFVHGCFWHRHHGCRYATSPQQNAQFWSEKFDANIARDQRNVERLVEAGWRVITVWECGLRNAQATAQLDSLCDLISYGRAPTAEWP